jgi:hypothetical protein
LPEAIRAASAWLTLGGIGRHSTVATIATAAARPTVHPAAPDVRVMPVYVVEALYQAALSCGEDPQTSPIAHQLRHMYRTRRWLRGRVATVDAFDDNAPRSVKASAAAAATTALGRTFEASNANATNSLVHLWCPPLQRPRRAMSMEDLGTLVLSPQVVTAAARRGVLTPRPREVVVLPGGTIWAHH